jgi:DNA adenine methylase
LKSTPCSQTLTRPFLKWPGGKFRLVSTLKSHLPPTACLVEPFVGAGSLFLNTNHTQVVVNDVNPDLITLYQQIHANCETYIQEARKLFCPKNNNAKTYYRIRERFNLSRDPWERSVLFLFLNRYGFNGLCRYNLKGLYNVPFGDYQNPYFPQNELEAFSLRAQKVVFSCGSYETLLEKFLQQKQLTNKVFYCDPPYAPLSATANFTGYAAHRFTLDDQTRLSHFATALMKKGATVVISNHDTPFTRKLYKTAQLHCVNVTRSISCQGATRQKVGELIACYHPKVK